MCQFTTVGTVVPPVTPQCGVSLVKWKSVLLSSLLDDTLYTRVVVIPLAQYLLLLSISLCGIYTVRTVTLATGAIV